MPSWCNNCNKVEEEAEEHKAKGRHSSDFLFVRLILQNCMHFVAYRCKFAISFFSVHIAGIVKLIWTSNQNFLSKSTKSAKIFVCCFENRQIHLISDSDDADDIVSLQGIKAVEAVVKGTVQRFEQTAKEVPYLNRSLSIVCSPS